VGVAISFVANRLKVMKKYGKMVQNCGHCSFRALEWAWQFFFCESIEINKTNKNVTTYQLIFQKCGRSIFVLFVVLEVGVASYLRCFFASKICMLNLNLLAFIVPEISKFIR